jgi:hypothetical protein
MSPERFVKGESERTLRVSLCGEDFARKPEFGGQICETCRARRSLCMPNANGSAIPSPVSLRKSQWFPSNG